MNLYHLTQNKVKGYDTYSDCVVAAETALKARNIHPSSYKITSKFIGKAKRGMKAGVICASFHAG